MHFSQDAFTVWSLHSKWIFCLRETHTLLKVLSLSIYYAYSTPRRKTQNPSTAGWLCLRSAALVATVSFCWFVGTWTLTLALIFLAHKSFRFKQVTGKKHKNDFVIPRSHVDPTEQLCLGWPSSRLFYTSPSRNESERKTKLNAGGNLRYKRQCHRNV